MIKPRLLLKYLTSLDSVFEVKSLTDFLATLTILGFVRVLKNENKSKNFQFVNANFRPDDPVPEDMYKQTFTLPKNATQISKSYGLELLERLLQMKRRQAFPVTKLEIAQMRLRFALQKQLDVLRHEPSNVEPYFEKPEYMKNNEIAGYYGNVSLDSLKSCFQNYFPIYLEENDDKPIVVEEPVTVALRDEVSMEPQRKKRKYNKKEVEGIEEKPIKTRSYNKKAREREDIQEANKAAMFLQMEAMQCAEE